MTDKTRTHETREESRHLVNRPAPSAGVRDDHAAPPSVLPAAVATTQDQRSTVRVAPQWLAQIVSDYRARTPASAAAAARARASLPGGETRSVTHFWPYPLTFASAQGARCVDVDGNTYLDLVNNYTSLVHGNAFAPVAVALSEVVSGPLALAATTGAQVDLAEALIDRVDSLETVRFTNSGSEANALALRLARRLTGRRRAVVFAGSYHSALPLLVPGEPEVTVVPYGDTAALETALGPVSGPGEAASAVAAVFAEPFLGAGGVIAAPEGFLRRVQDLAHRHGALFVLDEVQSLRAATGGAQSLHDLTPDLTTMGKIIGGGLPIGAVGGPRDLLAVTAAAEPQRLHHSGTFNGHVLAATAGLVTLRHLDAEAIDVLNDNAAGLARELTRAARSVHLPVTVTRYASILQVHLADRARTPEELTPEDHRAASALHLNLLQRGVATTPRGMVNLSTALTTADLRAVTAAYHQAFTALADAR